MLLIDPPMTMEEWIESQPDDTHLQSVFTDYCAKYSLAVLALPKDQLLKIWAQIVDGLEHCDVGPELIHVIVERELKEDDYEASTKVAKLVLLPVIVELIAARGIRLTPQTRNMLQEYRQTIFQVLAFAVSDHFGVLQVS